MFEMLKNMQEIDLGDHLVLLYRDKAAEKIVASFIAASLMRNERCLYIMGDTNTESMLFYLSELVDYHQAIEDGQLLILDKNDAYSKDGVFIPDNMIALLQRESKAAVNDGYSGLSVTGELNWVLDYAGGKEKIIEYEWKLNDRLFNDYPVTALCRYNIEKFSANFLKSIIELHPYIVYENQINENPFYIPPEGFRDNKLEEYEVITWLENIKNFTNTKSKFLHDIKKKDNEYRELFNKIQDGICVSRIDIPANDVIIKHVNKAAIKLSGYKRNELLGKSISMIDNTPDLLEKVSSVSDGYENTFESKLVRRDGLVKDVEINTKVYEQDGDKIVLTVARDISLKKKYVEDILATVTNFLEIHDNYTKGHSEKVAYLAKKTAAALGLSSEKITETYLTGLIHDIGKILISGDILNKPGRLSDEEFNIIKKHPTWAYEAIIKNVELSGIAKNAKHHHERWDGQGYPDGLKGNEIPIVSQVLIVVDAYDAMISKRAYRNGMEKQTAINELMACRGTQFPPNIVDVFIEKVIN